MCVTVRAVAMCLVSFYYFNITEPLSFRQQQLDQALLEVGQVDVALQGILDWLLQVEPQLDEQDPVHGDLGLVAHLVDSHKVALLQWPWALGGGHGYPDKFRGPSTLQGLLNA